MKSNLIICIGLVLLLSACGKSVYVSPSGAKMEMSEQSAYMNMQRDISTELVKALSKKGLTASQIVAISLTTAYGKIGSMKAPISWSEHVRNVAPIVQTLGLGGWFSQKEIAATSYIIKGSNNSMSNIGNTNTAGRDGMQQNLSYPQVHNEIYNQEDTDDSWNGNPDYNYQPNTEY